MGVKITSYWQHGDILGLLKAALIVTASQNTIRSSLAKAGGGQSEGFYTLFA